MTAPAATSSPRHHRVRTGSASTSAGRTASPGPRACSATRRTWPGSTPTGWASTAPGTPARGLAWVVRAVELGILAPIPLGSTLRSVDGDHRLPQGLGAAAQRGRIAGRRDASCCGRTPTGSSPTQPAACRAAIPAEFPAAFAVVPGPFEPGRVPLAAHAVDAAVLALAARPAGPRPDGPRQQRRLRGLPGGGAARGGRRGGGARWRRSPAGSGSSTSRPAAPAPAPRGRGADRRRVDGRWAWRLADAAGRGLAHATVTRADRRQRADPPGTFVLRAMTGAGPAPVRDGNRCVAAHALLGPSPHGRRAATRPSLTRAGAAAGDAPFGPPPRGHLGYRDRRPDPHACSSRSSAR